MKYFTLLIAMMSSMAFAATVINYDDGSTYTLAEGEEIYIDKGEVWKKSNLYGGKTIQFKKQDPWSKRDYVEPEPGPEDDHPVGSHQWCKAYVPWSEGYTFNMQAWDRFCDTNNDWKYGCGDEKFDNSEDGKACPSS